MAAEKHELETTFINLWVEAGIYELVVSTTIADTLHRLKIDLVDVNYVLKTGSVVRSDMLESRGLWDVRGKTTDEVPLEITIAVVSSSYEVELLRIVESQKELEEMYVVQHGGAVETRVVEKFEAKDLGAPFKVVLNDAVRVSFDKTTGEAVSYSIPDLDGLLGTIVITRILHARKLSGADIKFVRKALGVKQKDLAGKLELSVEHLSRCETGTLPMSPGSEKLLRIFALKTALKIDKLKACEEKTKLEDALDSVFDGMKPAAAYDVKDELVFHFYRVRPTKHESPGEDLPPDDGHWKDLDKAA